MTREEQLTQILEKSRDKEIIPFLKECTPEERKAIVPTLKKLTKYYVEFVENGRNSWRARANDKQFHILKCAQFVCYNRKEYEGAGSVWSIQKEFFDPILPWYCPSWFSDFINGLANGDFIPTGLEYDYVLELEQKGYLQPEPRLIARTLARWIFDDKDNKPAFLPEKLTLHKVTLEEHIWLMFQCESDIHSANRWLFYQGKRMELGWVDALRDHCNNGRIDRRRLISESMLASNRNFDKTLSGWFIDMFEAMEPKAEELLELKEELFTMFTSPHSKVVNSALKACKDIVDKQEFPKEQYLDNAQLLLSSATKATVTSALQILEKIVKKDKAIGQQVARAAATVFMHKDETLQTRAAKLIEKWGDVQDQEIRDALMLGLGAMFSGPRSLLAAYLDNPSVDMPLEEVEEHRTLDMLEPITPISDVDELVFLSAQLFDNNQPWHIDLFLDAAMRLREDIKGEDLEKFAPAVQRALKFYFGDWRSTQGLLDFMAARVFLDFMSIQAKRFPKENEALVELYRSHLTKMEENKKIWDEHGLNTTFYADPDKYTSDPYRPWHLLMKGILETLREGKERILLSTPTHAPYWIDPKVLIQRLSECKARGLAIDPMDFQIAMSRCWLQETANAIALASELLEGEMNRLMLFLLDKDRRPEGPFEMEYAWMTASLVKDPSVEYPELSSLAYHAKPRALFTGQYAWRSVKEDFEFETHEWKDGKYQPVKKSRIRKVIRVDVPKKVNVVKSAFDKVLSIFKGGKEKAAAELSPLLVEYMKIDEQYFLGREDKDMQRLYGLMPSRPEPLMSAILDRCLKEDPLEGETNKRAVINHLQSMYDANPTLGEMGHLYLSACLLCANKTAATYAAEFWIRNHRSLDNQRLGIMLGTHQRIEYAPMKRFTDLVMGKMMGVSPGCNRSLSVMISAMVGEIGEEPVKGMKKLAEIWRELGGGV